MPACISSFGIAVPEYETGQTEIADFMVNHLEMDDHDARNLKVLYRASGIRKRYSVVPDFQQNGHVPFFKDEAGKLQPSVGSRMTLYQQKALSLAKDALSNAIPESEFHEITHLITVSCTGMYAPGLDIELIESLGLSTSIQRTNINFMGCYAAFNALKSAHYIAQNEPTARVAVICVELCSIHFQDKTDDNTLLANALFGDGAAAVIVEGKRTDRIQLEFSTFYNDLALSGKGEMTWNVGDFGFDMKLSTSVPDVIRSGIKSLTERLLDKIQMQLEDVDYFAIHPGGKRILEVIEEELGLSKEQNSYARTILQQYGNMSSPTILFVLKSIWDTLSSEDLEKNILSFAFGPGLTMESMLLKVNV